MDFYGLPIGVCLESRNAIKPMILMHFCTSGNCPTPKIYMFYKGFRESHRFLKMQNCLRNQLFFYQFTAFPSQDRKMTGNARFYKILERFWGCQEANFQPKQQGNTLLYKVVGWIPRCQSSARTARERKAEQQGNTLGAQRQTFAL